MRPLPGPHNTIHTSRSTHPTQPASTSCLPSRNSSSRGMPEPKINAPTSRGNSIYPPNSTRRVSAGKEGWSSTFTAGFTPASQSATPTHAVNLKSSERPSLQGQVAQQSTHPTYPSLDLLKLPQPPVPPQDSSTSVTISERLSHLSGRYAQEQNPGMFNQAHDFTVIGTFIDGNVTYNNATSSQFMEKLLEKTIPGAASDSSARDPPPRCHPGTRLDILERCLYFIANCYGEKKIRWVVGVAGVGKSAIMQSVAESPNLPITFHASIFFSIIGSNDGTKAILTLSYQFAVKSEVYRRFIEDRVARDPSLLRSSISAQFEKLIVEPFIHHPQLKSGRVLVIIDGLDECNNPRTQQVLLRLISDFCITYPSSPIVWLIASRPEPHITSFFSRHKVITAYEKEEIPVDSDDSRADVERYLRNALTEIKESSDSLHPQWPAERDFWKLARAAGGLFAYAYTVIRYIGDPIIGIPASQLFDVLNVIDNHPITDVPREGEGHPMALLDALYARILSNVPPKVMANTRKLLLALASCWDQYLLGSIRNFTLLCNWLGLTPDGAYDALNHLRSVLYVPRRDEAHEEELKPFHKSFFDYISDFTRSRLFPDIQREAQQLKEKCAFRILNEAPAGIDLGDGNYDNYYGTLARGPGTGGEISVTWLVDEDSWNDNDTRLNLYKLATAEAAAGVGRGDPTFQTEFYIRSLTTRFYAHHSVFPRDQLRDLVFAGSRRDEFLMQGILKQMPVHVVCGWNLIHEVKLRVWCRDTTVTNLSDPWDPVCTHRREGEWEEKKCRDWSATFPWNTCRRCFRRFQLQLARIMIQSPDRTIPVLFFLPERCCVEFQFVDPEYGVAEWRYWFWYELSWEEREMYGRGV